ncbi:hypothetical protein ACFQ9X_05815 [Catenulispora yoronensis]
MTPDGGPDRVSHRAPGSELDADTGFDAETELDADSDDPRDSEGSAA